MKRTLSWMPALASVLVVVLGAALGRAQTPEGETYSLRLADLEARMKAIEAGGASCQEGCVAEYEACSCANCRRTAGPIFGGEVVFLQPHHSNGIQGIDGTDLRFDFEASPRVWLGWTTCSGLGFRARYWDFDHTATGPSGEDPALIVGHGFDVATIDMEITDTLTICRVWDLTLSGGARYVDFEERQFATGGTEVPVNAAIGYRSSSWGPTLGAELRRPVWRCVSLIGNVRGSILFGDENEFTDPDGLLIDHEQSNVRSIGEMQLCAEWRRETCRGSRWFLRGAVEGQYWSGFSGEHGFDGNEAIGFFGFALSAGLSR